MNRNLPSRITYPIKERNIPNLKTSMKLKQVTQTLRACLLAAALVSTASATTVLVDFNNVNAGGTAANDPTPSGGSSNGSGLGTNGLYYHNVFIANNQTAAGAVTLYGGGSSVALIHTANASSGWTLSLSKGASGTVGTAGTGANYTGPYPAALSAFDSTALRDSIYLNNLCVLTVSITGLDNTRNYNLLAYGGRGNNAGPQTNSLTVGSSPSTTTVTFNSHSDEANAVSAVAWTNTAPSSGQIAFTISAPSNIVNSNTAAINFLQLVSSPASPAFSPAGGGYSTATNVTLSSDAGATIYYTTDGSTPTASSTLYASAINLSLPSTTTIKAIAVQSGAPNSPVSSATYTLAAPATITPSPTSFYAVSTTYGTASSSTSVGITGSSLSADITATAPTGFEVSSDNSTFGPTATFPQSGGNASGTLYLRLKNNAPVSGTYNSVNVTLTSGITAVNVATASTGNSVAAKALTVASATAQSKLYDGTAAAAITATLQSAEAFGSGNSSDGVPYTGDTLTVSVSGTFASSAVGGPYTVTPGTYTLAGISAGNYALTQPSISLSGYILSAPTWTATSGGSWANAGNWFGSLIATNTGVTADFSTLTMTANQTVTLDGARTIGNLWFDDRSSTKYAWALNTGSGGPLTLAVGSGSPIVSNNVQTTIGAAIAGTQGLTKTGNGMLALTNYNTYSGGTTVSAGTLAVANSNNATGTITITNGTLTVAGNWNNAGNVNIYNGGVLTITSGGLYRAVNGGDIYQTSYAVTVKTGGILNLKNWQYNADGGLGGASAYSAQRVLDGGIANVTGALSATNSCDFRVTANGGTLNMVTSGQTLAITDNAYDNIRIGGPLTLSGAGSIIISEVMQDNTTPGSIIKTGAGPLTLSGANLYTGGTTVSNGTLALGSTAAIGTGALTLSGGNLDSSVASLVNANNNAQNWNADFTFVGTQNLDLGAGAVAMNASRQVTVIANTLTVGGLISGSTFGLTKLGNGTLTLNAAETYTGNTTISAGTLALGASGALASTPAITIAGGSTFDVSATFSGFTFTGFSPVQTLAAASTNGTANITTTGQTVTLNSGALLSFQADGTGSGTVGKISVAGDLTLNANAVTVNVTGAPLGIGTYTLLDCTGTLANTGTFGGPAINGLGLANGTGAYVSVTPGSAGHVDLVVVAATSTTLTLTRTSGGSPSTYGDPLTFHAVVSPDPGDGSVITFMTNGVSIGTATTTGGAAHLTIASLPYSGVSALPVTASFSGSVSYAASTGGLSGGQQVNRKALTVASATAQDKLYDDTTAASVTGTLQTAEMIGTGTSGDGMPFTGDTLTVGCSGSTFASSAVGGPYTVTAGTFILGGSSAGNYTLTQPTGLSLSASILSTATWTSNSTGDSWTNSANWLNSLVGAGTNNTADFSTLTMIANQTLTLDGARTMGNLIFGDVGNTYGWTVNTGSGGPLTLAVNSGSPVVNVSNLTATIGAVIAGTQGFTKTGNGTLTLIGSAAGAGGSYSTYGGATLINAGTLNTVNRGPLSSSSPVTINNGATLLVQTPRVFDQDGLLRGTMTMNDGSAVVIDPSLNSNARIELAHLDMTGGTISDNGVGSSSAYFGLSTTNINIHANATASTIGGRLYGQTVSTLSTNGAITFTVDGSAQANVSAAIVNGPANPSVVVSSLIKSGAGALTLSGVSTYTGATTVSNGTLLVSGSTASDSAVTVASGATFGGDGTIGGPTTIQPGATLSPGAGGIGTLTFGGSLTLNAGSTTFVEVDAANALNDLVSFSAASYGGSLVVSNLAGAGTVTIGQSFQIFSAGGANSFSSITPNPGPGLVWHFDAGTGFLTAVSGVNTSATNINLSVAGGNLDVSWPADHIGWQLQVQTNSLAVGLSGNWAGWPGSTTTNQVAIPIVPANPTVFLRLVYPPQ
jgi:fibronectin-binding autotransporter adhesin